MDVSDNISTYLRPLHNPHMAFLFLLSWRRISRKPSDYPSSQVICTVNWSSSVFRWQVFPQKATSLLPKLALIYSNFFSIDTAVANLSTGKLIKLHLLLVTLSSYSLWPPKRSNSQYHNFSRKISDEEKDRM